MPIQLIVADHVAMLLLSHRATTLKRIELALDLDYVVTTLNTLERRIEERFPDSGLARLCGRLVEIGGDTRSRLRAVERPIWWLRSATLILAALMILGGLGVFWAVAQALVAGVQGPFAVLQLLESGIQDLVFLGIGLATLVTLESRVKRRRSLEAIRELRALAHIVDMHQLTKDPDQFVRPMPDTKSSPDRLRDAKQIGRYLDYCSEMLSLTSKIAALYAERLNDAVVLQAVDEVETLTTGLSRKIWQKIMILDLPQSGSGGPRPTA